MTSSKKDEMSEYYEWCLGVHLVPLCMHTIFIKLTLYAHCIGKT